MAASLTEYDRGCAGHTLLAIVLLVDCDEFSLEVVVGDAAWFEVVEQLFRVRTECNSLGCLTSHTAVL